MTTEHDIAELLRATRPEQILGVYATTRHSDHQALAHLVSGAVVEAAALHRLPVATDDLPLASARLWYYEAELPITPTLLVPCTEDDWGQNAAMIATPPDHAHRCRRTGNQHWPQQLSPLDQRARSAWGWHANAPAASAEHCRNPVLRRPSSRALVDQNHREMHRPGISV